MPLELGAILPDGRAGPRAALDQSRSRRLRRSRQPTKAAGGIQAGETLQRRGGQFIQKSSGIWCRQVPAAALIKLQHLIPPTWQAQAKNQCPP